MIKVKAEDILRWLFFALLIFMPFSLFFSRWLSLYTGGLGQWDAFKDIIMLIGLVIAVYIAFKKGFLQDTTVKYVFLAGTAYALLHLVFIIFNPLLDTRSFIVGFLYNGRIVAYLFIGLVVGKTSLKSLKSNLILKLIIILSSITVIFALAQYFLPKDLMTHFGYSIERGVKPSFFIDDKPNLPRVFSTIRDPNSYGAFLILPITAIWLSIISNLKIFKKKTLLTMLSLHLLALFLTFSRGAWIGVIISFSVLSVYKYRKLIKPIFKKHLLIISFAVIFLGIFGYVWRNSYFEKNILLHKDQSTVLTDPNQLRIELQSAAVKEILNKPLGHGPGTAGLASIGNPRGTILTENYFLQIAYEIGLLGLGIFIAILAITYVKLIKNNDVLSRVLIVTFWGYVFIAMLIHLWSNEAVAAQWWLLAGLSIGQITTSSNRKYLT